MIHYTKGYKYQLKETYHVLIDIKEQHDMAALLGDKHCTLIDLCSSGKLSIKRGYAWDGPSGPTLDTKSFMRGSLVHDALYQLMRERGLNQSYRKYADELLKEMCVEDGMSKIRAWLVYCAVRFAGAPSADPKNKREVLTAP